MVDARGLGPRRETCGGSSPLLGTTKEDTVASGDWPKGLGGSSPLVRTALNVGAPKYNYGKITH